MRKIMKFYAFRCAILAAPPLLIGMAQPVSAGAPADRHDPSPATPIGLVQRPDVRHGAWTSLTELGDQRFELSAVRFKTRRSIDASSMVPDSRIASWSLVARYDHDIASLGSLGLVGTVDVEKRHPWGLLSRGKPLGSRTMFAGFEWSGGEAGRLSLGVYRSTDTGTRRGFDRLAELASGAPLKASGLRLAFDFASWVPDDRSERGTTIGIDARLQHIAQTDVDLLGGRPHARDGQLMLNILHRF